MRFVLELTALAAVWGSFVAPRARWFGPALVRIVIEAVVFAVATAAWFALGQSGWGMAFAVLVVAQAIVVHARRDVEATRADALGRGPLA